jgi:hypothetical protein
MPGKTPDAGVAAEVAAPVAPEKFGVIALLRIGRDGWSGEDWRAFFDERAGIAEFDGGLPRQQAEARAFMCCVADWLNRNPVRSSADRCLRCGEAEQDHDALCAVRNRIHRLRLAAFALLVGLVRRQHAEAVAALAAIGIGIATPARFPNDFDKNGGA